MGIIKINIFKNLLLLLLFMELKLEALPIPRPLIIWAKLEHQSFILISLQYALCLSSCFAI